MPETRSNLSPNVVVNSQALSCACFWPDNIYEIMKYFSRFFHTLCKKTRNKYIGTYSKGEILSIIVIKKSIKQKNLKFAHILFYYFNNMVKSQK